MERQQEEQALSPFFPQIPHSDSVLLRNRRYSDSLIHQVKKTFWISGYNTPFMLVPCYESSLTFYVYATVSDPLPGENLEQPILWGLYGLALQLSPFWGWIECIQLQQSLSLKRLGSAT